MTWVKICGITNLEDALAAVDAGANALGFVFYEKSPRRVDAARVCKIVKELPNTVEKVGVFVMPSKVEMEFVAEEARLTGWQLHKGVNGEPLENVLHDCGFFRLSKRHAAKKVYVSLPASLLIDEGQYRGITDFKLASGDISALFVDSGNGDLPGGTGWTFDWKHLQPTIRCLSSNLNVVVAGGLTASNVAEAMRTLHPWGVDVSSGVEAKPGKKDHEKIRAFIRAVREADKAHSK